MKAVFSGLSRSDLLSPQLTHNLLAVDRSLESRVLILFGFLFYLIKTINFYRANGLSPYESSTIEGLLSRSKDCLLSSAQPIGLATNAVTLSFIYLSQSK